ncbi:NYN domain-containing protein [Pleurocapsales cyanobacterium LEGE 06147]|nr:NYN domain-containing protein [Pleurocapsales cyanobacterium LEGE 06147]
MLLSPYQVLLLVDGYNIIGAWSALKQSRDRHGLETARQQLVETLIDYAAIQAYQTYIIFDAHYQNTPSYREVCTSLVSVYYTAFAETADTYIEKFCAAFQNNRQQKALRLIVATSDRAQRLTVTGYGAEWISAQRLAVEVEMTARQINRRKRPRKKAAGRFLYNSLDPAAQQRLLQWRKGSF